MAEAYAALREVIQMRKSKSTLVLNENSQNQVGFLLPVVKNKSVY